MGRRPRRLAVWALAVTACAIVQAGAPGPARAAPPKEERDPPKSRADSLVPAPMPAAPVSDSAAARTPQPVRPIPRDEPLPEVYRSVVRGTATRSRADTVGTALFLLAKEAFHRGEFVRADTLAKAFAERHPRNLNVNDALELTLLLKDYRDFQDEPLRIYARALAHREAGAADSATRIASKGLERFPGAKIRHHWRHLMAELAYARGDYAAALVQARAVADTTTKSRLAPHALRLAGDAALASGAGPEEATRYYQALLVRYPDSPLAPGVRAKLLTLRKGMQL